MNARARLETTLLQLWQERSWRTYVLLPVAGLYGLLLGLRRALYAVGLLQQTRMPVPVIVVGNIFVGGTGKTPLVIWLVEQLRARGWHPGVIARGYGAQADHVTEVNKASDARSVGDEPVLIQHRTAAPVVIGRNRVLAAQQLLRDHPSADVLISDDGLQHYALARTIEIQLRDERGHGNGWLLPAGPLREPASRRADFFVLNAGSKITASTASLPAMSTTASMSSTSDATGDGVAAAATNTIYRMTLHAELMISLTQPTLQQPLSATPTNQRIAAAAGIGNPQRFFEMLRAHGITLSKTLALPDHFDYRRNPFEAIHADRILITEKDAVKCARIADLANDARLWVVPVTALIAEPLLDHILEILRGHSAA